jgi:hypothetical protein
MEQGEYGEKPGSLLSPNETVQQSERAAGIHIMYCAVDDEFDWNSHWANVHVSAAFYISEYLKMLGTIKLIKEAKTKKAKMHLVGMLSCKCLYEQLADAKKRKK